jgi:hypothetical protein
VKRKTISIFAGVFLGILLFGLIVIRRENPDITDNSINQPVEESITAVPTLNRANKTNWLMNIRLYSQPYRAVK